MQPGSTYHLFNHANGWENLFCEDKNYDFFLGRLSIHVLPVAHIYAYCLMPNHFHLLLKIKDEDVLTNHFKLKNENIPEEEIVSSTNKNAKQDLLKRKVSKSFSNFFNSYTQAFNKMYERKGSLFMPNMKREEVVNEGSFCKVIHYIHTNPVHHKFVEKIDMWSHSSYKIFLSKSSTKLEREYTLDVFGGLDWFIKYHQQPIDPKNKWLDF